MLTATSVCFILLVLRPGYWINDDVKIVWNLAGYPGYGAPTQFMIHSNILVGLILAPLYGLHASANWYVILLATTNALAIWAFLALGLAARYPAPSTRLGLAIIVAGTSTLVLNMTYTVSAFLSSLAGICLIWASAQRPRRKWRRLAVFGLTLVVLGWLLRPPMLLMGVLIALPGMLTYSGTLSHRRGLLLLLLAGIAVGATYAIDRVYVRASPDWNLFYAHSRVRQQLHDTHRLNNVHNQIRRIGWSPNDQELFAHWFYPDEQKYSLERLSYLVKNVPPASQDPGGTLQGFLGQLLLPQFAPYLVWMAAIALFLFARASSRSTALGVTAIWMVTFGLNAGLSVIYKDPAYVLACTLAGGLILSVLLPAMARGQNGFRGRMHERTAWSARFLGTAALAASIAGVGLQGNLLWRASQENLGRQADYHRIRTDLEQLQDEGTVAENALIVSPAHGLPYEWANPLRLDLPSPAYLDMGWITFSPSYYRALASRRIASLPDALLENDDVYLMTESSFIPFLARYYEERSGKRIRFDTIYSMPNPGQVPGYDDVRLYKLRPAD
jgi:hypothetical protein